MKSCYFQMPSVDHCSYCSFFTCKSWQKFFAGKNLVTAQTQLHLYTEQRVFEIGNICYTLTYN